MTTDNGSGWLASSQDERKALYKAAKKIIDEAPMEWSALYAAAYDRVFAIGRGYENNFRAGRIDRTKAMLIYRWIRRNHEEVARALDAEVAQLRREALPQAIARMTRGESPRNRAKFIIVPVEPRERVTRIYLPKALLREILNVIANGIVVDDGMVAVQADLTDERVPIVPDDEDR